MSGIATSAGPAPDLDALIERLSQHCRCGACTACQTERIEAAAALAELRKENARLSKLETECWSNPEAWMKWCDVRVLERAEHAEAEVARLTTTSTHQINSSQRRC